MSAAARLFPSHESSRRSQLLAQCQWSSPPSAAEAFLESTSRRNPPCVLLLWIASSHPAGTSRVQRRRAPFDWIGPRVTPALTCFFSVSLAGGSSLLLSPSRCLPHFIHLQIHRQSTLEPIGHSGQQAREGGCLACSMRWVGPFVVTPGALQWMPPSEDWLLCDGPVVHWRCRSADGRGGEVASFDGRSVSVVHCLHAAERLSPLAR